MICGFLVAVTAVCIACSDDAETPSRELAVSATDLLFPQVGGQQVLLIQAGETWTLTGDTEWCTLSATTGEAGKTARVTVAVSTNTTSSERTATLTVTAGAQTKSVSVRQALTLQTTQRSYTAAPEGSIVRVEVATQGGHTVRSNNGWIARVTATGRTTSILQEQFAVEANYTGAKRIGTVTFLLDGMEQTVTIEQAPIASLPADLTGVERNALQLAKQMRIGWNLGNSLEALGGETAWGNPATTQALIDMVKQAGFNTVRIPCNWMSGYVWEEEMPTIKVSWLARVKEVIDYCMKNDMYAVLNIHYDGGWLELNPLYTKQEEVNRKQRALWTQIATYFRQYDEHLLFAGTNEVHVNGVYDIAAVTAENHTVQQSFNQTFVDAVRATGGKNAHRNLIVQAYNTNIQLAAQLKMPTDPAGSGRLFMEVHYYDPWEFGGDVKSAYWGAPYAEYGVSTWGQEAHVDAQFAALKKQFVDQGIPVFVGEFGANRHSLTDETKLASRAYYLEYVSRTAKNHGAVPVYWDNGGLGNGDTAGQFGLFDRHALKVFDPTALAGLMKGAAAGVYPF